MAFQRLDKILSDSGACSRSAAKEQIKKGNVTVDSVVVTDSAAKFDPSSVTISLNGTVINTLAHVYFMLNKPSGLLSATEDARKPTVIDLFPEEYRRRGIFPVGRLDKDTTGFLIITDDGDFAHKVISPKYHIPKLYEAQVDGEPTASDFIAFQEGIILGDGTKCLPAKLTDMGNHFVRVEVFEGKYHQVKRMLGSCLLPVITLKRLRIGNIDLDPALEPGEYRPMTVEELQLILPNYMSK